MTYEHKRVVDTVISEFTEISGSDKLGRTLKLL